MLTGLIIGGAGGLIFGWVFLPQPEWFKRLWAYLFTTKSTSA